MASIQFTEADRDERGFVKVPAAEPRDLADLLPTPSAIHADAGRVVRQPPTNAEWAAMAALALGLIALVAYLWTSGDARPVTPPRAPATAQTSGDGSTAPSPPPATVPATAGRLLIAFASPDGDPLGAIESTRLITPTAHYGSDWIQADVAGSGLVWLRQADVPALAIVGPDLAPRPTATAAPYVAPTPVPQPPCLTAGTGAQTVTICAWLESEQLRIAAANKWIETYGGNVGVVSTPTPQEWNKP